MISRALEAEIVRLHHTEHWPVGTIAAQLRVHHATVRRVLPYARQHFHAHGAAPISCS